MTTKFLWTQARKQRDHPADGAAQGRREADFGSQQVLKPQRLKADRQ
jgi:hypothetical protein